MCFLNQIIFDDQDEVSSPLLFLPFPSLVKPSLFTLLHTLSHSLLLTHSVCSGPILEEDWGGREGGRSVCSLEGEVAAATRALCEHLLLFPVLPCDRPLPLV